MARILVVTEDPALRSDCSGQLRKRGHEVREAATQSELDRWVGEEEFDLILADLAIGAKAVGLELLDRMRREEAATEIVLLVPQDNVQSAGEALRKGASDILALPSPAELLLPVVQRALERKRLKSQVRHLSSALKRRQQVEGIVYRSQQLGDILRLVERASQAEATMLIQGESGTGKEMIARAAHAQSPRRNGPFYAVDCGTIPENLLESELFGHKRGAFTGAESTRKGLFESARGGTLLLDEVGEMPFPLQVKLLRVLQEKEIRPVGDDRPRKIDVRILAATNKDLGEEIHRGRFREDLYYRLNVISIRVPSLRERPDDILPLAKHFLQKHAKKWGREPLEIDPEGAKMMLRYPWPGNVRELENAMERALALANGKVLRSEDLPDLTRQHKCKKPLECLEAAGLPGGVSENPLSPFGMDAELTLEEMEKRYILHVLKQQGGNRVRAAAVLRIGRNTLWRKLKAYGCQGDGDRDVHG